MSKRRIIYLAVFIAALGVSAFYVFRPGTVEESATIDAPVGQVTVKSKGSSLTSLTVVADSDSQRKNLETLLIDLETPKLVAYRTCSVIVTFGKLSDEGLLYNCAGERVGALSKDAEGFLKDIWIDALNLKAEKGGAK